jgi:hypothetical protein
MRSLRKCRDHGAADSHRRPASCSPKRGAASNRGGQSADHLRAVAHPARAATVREPVGNLDGLSGDHPNVAQCGETSCDGRHRQPRYHVIHRSSAGLRDGARSPPPSCRSPAWSGDLRRWPMSAVRRTLRRVSQIHTSSDHRQRITGIGSGTPRTGRARRCAGGYENNGDLSSLLEKSPSAGFEKKSDRHIDG